MSNWQDKLNSLTPFTRSVALQKATEAPFSGRFIQKSNTLGTYICRRCGLPLWETNAQFASHCGWPSFDHRLPNSIKEAPDEDGFRTEIICQRCSSHLGHVFHGEGFTNTNMRDCVNSVMMDFIPHTQIHDTEEIIVAGGCFWGVEYFLAQADGVLLTECGYIGGTVEAPNYDIVCSNESGHYEAVRVIFDPHQTSCQTLYKLFFEIHDPTQAFGQGPDIGTQYQSAIFYHDDNQKNQANLLIEELQKNSFKVKTKLLNTSVFWPAETFHQQYYQKTNKAPYCHRHEHRFK